MAHYHLFKASRKDFFSAPLLVPTHFYYKNYIEAWNSVPFARYIINSTIMSLGIVICQTLFSAMAGYAFAKIKFKFKDALFLIFFNHNDDT